MILFCIIILLFTKLLSCASSQEAKFPKGRISPILHEQALSHLAFHSNPMKLALASLFPSLKSVAIVGVEWGEEAVLFANKGYHVYAFEPARKFVKNLQTLKAAHPEWKLTVVAIAAGNTTDGSIVLQYDNAQINETVAVGKVDDHVQEALAVFSLDIQGDELHVLQGSTKLISRDIGVASLWVEAFSCSEKVVRILDMLDDEYVGFDFVPWGRHNSQIKNGLPVSLQSFAYYPDRPNEYGKFVSWMCEQRKTSFQWLQTDILFIRRDYLSESVVEKLMSLSEDMCSASTEKGGANCRLRDILIDNGSDDKEEL